MRHNISNVTRTILLIELGLAIYMTIVLFSSLYDNYQIDTYIEDFEAKNNDIAAENIQLQEELAYYTSPQYQDKIAKQNFGLINPGEEVLILPHTPEPGQIDLKVEQLSKRLQYYQGLETPAQWWYLLTHNS